MTAKEWGRAKESVSRAAGRATLRSGNRVAAGLLDPLLVLGLAVLRVMPPRRKKRSNRLRHNSAAGVRPGAGARRVQRTRPPETTTSSNRSSLATATA